MCLTTESKKITIVCLFIFLATVSIITGKTLANTIILTHYRPSILPYFYFSQAILMMFVTLSSSKYLKKSPTKFANVFKLTVLFSLLIFIFLMKCGGIVFPFFISILLLSYISIISIIAWNYASDIFNLQEFKRFSKVLQISSTSGAIAAGLLVAILSKKFHPSILFGLLFLAELTSFFLIKPLAKHVFYPPASSARKKHLNLAASTIFKYLALMTLLGYTISTLIDYNLKLELLASIDKDKIAHTLSLIFTFSIIGTLLVQLFFLDYCFRVFGSKKIIIIYPLVILIATTVTLIHFNIILMAALFIIDDIARLTTSSLSKKLYLNVLPQGARILGRLKLKGIFAPLAIISTSLIIFGIMHMHYKLTLVLVLIVLLCIFSLYVATRLIQQYGIELAKSLYLRRFNSDLINLSPRDNKDIEYVIKQALDYHVPEATIFGLQLLNNNKSLQLPNSLIGLLTGDNSSVVREAASILAGRRNQQEFFNAAMHAFSKSDDEETKWYLALYLMESDLDPFLSWAKELIKIKIKTGVLLAIYCLINIKNGDLEHRRNAMELLLKMFHSQDIMQKKWFLYVLHEMSDINKEEYLVEFINQDNSALQILALKQVDATASDTLIDSIVSHIGEINIAYALNNCLIIIGDRVVGRIENRFRAATTYSIKLSCIQALSVLVGNQSDQSLMRLLSTTHDVVLQTVIAKYIAYRGVKNKISEELNGFLINKIEKEVAFYFQLTNGLLHYNNPLIQEEIISRLQYIKKRVLYYTAAIVGYADILNAVPLLTDAQADKHQQALAVELIDSTVENRKIASLLLSLSEDYTIKGATASFSTDDPWLSQYIQDIESNNMDEIYTLTRLRKIDLFKNLPAETLQVLAECCSTRDMSTGEVIFYEGDAGDGLYIIDTGEVAVKKKGKVIAKLSESDYFGELALLVDMPRYATVTAISEGVLFYIDKQDFDKITDEIPGIMKNINKQIIKYLVTDFEGK